MRMASRMPDTRFDLGARCFFMKSVAMIITRGQFFDNGGQLGPRRLARCPRRPLGYTEGPRRGPEDGLLKHLFFAWAAYACIVTSLHAQIAQKLAVPSYFYSSQYWT